MNGSSKSGSYQIGWLAIPAVSAEAVALFRIVFGAALLWLFARYNFFYAQHYAPETWRHYGIASLEPLIWLARSPAACTALRVVLCLAAASFTIGLATRFSAIVMMLAYTLCCSVSLQRAGAHDLALLFLVLPAFCVGRWNDALSVDSVLRSRRGRDRHRLAAPGYGMGLWLITLAMSLAYGGAAYAKVRNGPDWIMEGAVRNHVMDDMMKRSTINPYGWEFGLAEYVATHKVVGVAASAAAVIIEFGFVLVLFSRRYWQRLLIGLSGLALHLGIYVLQGQIWWKTWMVCYLVFLPWEHFGELYRRWRSYVLRAYSGDEAPAFQVIARRVAAAPGARQDLEKV